MLPDLNDYGVLPAGIHVGDLEEIAVRFGQQSEIRRVQMESLRWLIDLARKAGMQRLIINGSFVTDALEPNDVDCVLLIGSGKAADCTSRAELESGLPFLDIHLLLDDEFGVLVDAFFATDRYGRPKGVVEVIL